MDLLVYIKTDSGAIDNGGSSHSINFLRSVPTCECVCSHARVFSNKHSRTGHTLYLSTHTHIFVLSWFKPRTCWPYREKAHVRFCVHMCTCAYWCVYTIAYWVASHEHIKKIPHYIGDNSAYVQDFHIILIVQYIMIYSVYWIRCTQWPRREHILCTVYRT